jgi:hypothetical protein
VRRVDLFAALWWHVSPAFGGFAKDMVEAFETPPAIALQN